MVLGYVQNINLESDKSKIITQQVYCICYQNKLTVKLP